MGSIERAPEKSPIRIHGDQNISVPQQKAADIVEVPQKAEDSNQSDPPITTTEGEQGSIPGASVEKAQLFDAQAKLQSREPVIFPSHSSVVGVINETAPPLSVINPPIKFIPPISTPVTGMTIGNIVNQREQ